MKKAFNRKAGNAADIQILAKHFDPHVDGHLLLAQIKGESQYFVGWQSRHKDGIVDRHKFATRQEASDCFDRILTYDERTDHRNSSEPLEWQSV